MPLPVLSSLKNFAAAKAEYNSGRSGGLICLLPPFQTDLEVLKGPNP